MSESVSSNGITEREEKRDRKEVNKNKKRKKQSQNESTRSENFLSLLPSPKLSKILLTSRRRKHLHQQPWSKYDQLGWEQSTWEKHQYRHLV